MDDFNLIPMKNLDMDDPLLKDMYLDVYQMQDVQGSDVLDDLINKGLVKANPKRGSSIDKKDAFQDFLNRSSGQLVAQAPSEGVAGPANVVPSQMPNAMGGMPTHGITQDLAPIPGTAMGNMGGMVTDFGKGVEAIKEAKDKGGLMNPETRRMLEMLQGY